MHTTEKQFHNSTTFLKEKISTIDSETLETYSILENQHPEVLYLEDINVPKEKINWFASKHYEIYSRKAKEILRELPDSLILSSGMFGGKTTLSFLILEELERQGRNIEFLIADVMGEDTITARAYKGEETRPAIKFGALTNYKETIDNLAKSNIEVIFLDEFSFLDVNIVEDLQEMCLDTKKKLVLTGLNASYLGQPLPAFDKGSKVKERSKIEKCYSFVPKFCEDKPLGTNTIRYAKIEDRWILDVGLLPLVVSKEKSHFVHYSPAMQEHTAAYIFKNHPEILDSIFYPKDSKKEFQEILLQKLDQESQ